MDIKEKIEKLPKWAQHHIMRLEQEVDDLKRNIDCMVGNETKIQVGYDKFYIPDDMPIRFKVGNNKFDISIVDGELKIYGDNIIQIFPRATNHIILK